MKEFENLYGKEIQQAKDAVLRGVNYFAGVKHELEQKRQQGKRVTADDHPYLNMLIFGAPGTGKTTIARIAAKMMFDKGILPTNKVVEVQASTLGSSKVQGVKEKLFEVAEKANGGVLLIDELSSIQGAYEGGNLAEDFMRGLVSVINKYRNTLCVILCGYEEDVLSVVKYDEGANRRFSEQIKLESYSIDTLMGIFQSLVEKDGETLGEGVEERVKEIILEEKAIMGKSFGNAGYIKEQLIGKLKREYFARGAWDKVYTLEDVNAAFPIRV